MPTIHAKKAPIQIDHCLEATNREPLSLQHVLHISPGVIFGTFIIGPGDLSTWNAGEENSCEDQIEENLATYVGGGDPPL